MRTFISTEGETIAHTGNSFVVFTNIFLMMIPIITLIFGVELIRRKINKPIGIILCILPILSFFPVYFFMAAPLVPRMSIICGGLLCVAGALEKTKLHEDESTKASVYKSLILSGILLSLLPLLLFIL